MSIEDILGLFSLAVGIFLVYIYIYYERSTRIGLYTLIFGIYLVFSGMYILYIS